MPNVDNTLTFYFSHILYLDVSNNWIKSVEPYGLCKACPFLERLNFSDNLIADMGEIMPLGNLRHL